MRRLRTFFLISAISPTEFKPTDRRSSVGYFNRCLDGEGKFGGEGKFCGSRFARALPHCNPQAVLIPYCNPQAAHTITGAQWEMLVGAVSGDGMRVEICKHFLFIVLH